MPTPRTRKPAPKRKTLADRTPLLEWIAAGVGALLTLGAIGFLTWEALSPDEGPPVLTASAEGATPTPGGYLVPIRVKNLGRDSASAVEVEGTVASGGRPLETSGVTFDYVPGLGERQGVLMFQTDPRGRSLSVVARGLASP